MRASGFFSTLPKDSALPLTCHSPSIILYTKYSIYHPLSVLTSYLSCVLPVSPLGKVSSMMSESGVVFCLLHCSNHLEHCLALRSCSLNEWDEWTKLLSSPTWLCFISGKFTLIGWRGSAFPVVCWVFYSDFMPAWGPCALSSACPGWRLIASLLMQMACQSCAWPAFPSSVVELCSACPFSCSYFPTSSAASSGTTRASCHLLYHQKPPLCTQKELSVQRPWHCPYVSPLAVSFPAPCLAVCIYSWPLCWITRGGLCPSLTVCVSSATPGGVLNMVSTL